MSSSQNQGSPLAAPTSRTVFVSIALLVIGIPGGFLFGRWLNASRESSYLSQARELMDQSSADEAIRSYERHLQQFPKDDAARLEFAKALQRIHPDDALRELRAIRPESNEYLEAARLVAAISLSLGRDYDALAPLKLLQSEFPDDAGVHQAMAEIYFRQRDFDRSLEHSTRCLELNPDSVEALLLVAEAKDSLRRTAEMIEPLEAALRLDPEVPQAHLNLAYAYEASGQFDEAMPHVEWFLKRYPSSISALRILASVQRGQGHYQEALASAEKALELAPGNPDCTILAAELLLFLRRPAEACDLLNPIAAERPTDRRILTPLLRALVLSGSSERAKEIQAQLQELDASRTGS